MNVWELIGKLGEAMVTKKNDVTSSEEYKVEKTPDEKDAKPSSYSSGGYSAPHNDRVKPRKQTVEDMLRRHAEISKRIDESNKPESE